MKNNEKASLPVLRVLIITITMILVLGITVIGFSGSLKNVKIIFANNYEMEVLTTKTKVSDILEESHIVILPEESVVPNLDSEISENNTITITKVSNNGTEVVKLAEENADVSLEQLLGNYSTIVEKIVVEQVTIPYETITKNVSSNSNNTTNNVLQNGVDGLKEVTYKIKYQNDIEIERTVISETIIKEAVNKIVQVQSNSLTTTSRSGSYKTTTTTTTASNTLASKVEGITPQVVTLNASAYCSCSTCCGKTNGITASGATATAWYTVAAGKGYPLGTIIYIPALSNKPNGGWFVVQDRGGAISNNKLDIFLSTHNEALQFGRKNLECYVYILQ
jgi:3D (Asp-Asp-Asp) domain-containing protein